MTDSRSFSADLRRNPQARWISIHILPHEGDLRCWLRRFASVGMEENDVIQEAYCRIAGLHDYSRIRSGRAYFFTVARSIVLAEMRRQRVVRIEAVAEIERFNISDDRPSAEQDASARQELDLVRRLIGALPNRCRRIFVLRRVLGLSQRETADRTGLSENVVEKETAAGLRSILKQLAEHPNTTVSSAELAPPGRRRSSATQRN